MLSLVQKEKFLSLKVEIINLNILTYVYVKKRNRLGYLFRNSTRYFIFEEFTALRYMENGIILQLTNLDDDNSSFSFRKVQKEINKTIKEKKILTQFQRKLEVYRIKINKLKVKYRNNRIAHLNYDTDLNIDEFLNFDTHLRPLITLVNEIGDFIWGEKINYEFKLGSIEGVLDFRKLCEELKIDFNEQNGII